MQWLIRWGLADFSALIEYTLFPYPPSLDSGLSTYTEEWQLLKDGVMWLQWFHQVWLQYLDERVDFSLSLCTCFNLIILSGNKVWWVLWAFSKQQFWLYYWMLYWCEHYNQHLLRYMQLGCGAVGRQPSWVSQAVHENCWIGLWPRTAKTYVCVHACICTSIHREGVGIVSYLKKIYQVGVKRNQY